ncbi:MAG: hypothetical protein ACR2QE_02485 [Acidimicrobiales bacterium]
MTRSQGTKLFQELNMVFSGNMDPSIYDTALANLKSSDDMAKVAKTSSLMVVNQDERDHFKQDWLAGIWWPNDPNVGPKLKTAIIKAIKAARKSGTGISFVWTDNATDGKVTVDVDPASKPVTVTVTSPPAKA